MRDQQLYHQLVARMKENASLPSADLGPLTGVYQKTAGWFGERPWRLIAPLAAGASLAMSKFLGEEFIRLASILQGGF